MTDPITPEPTPAPAAPVYAPVATGPRQVLSLTSFILGLAGLVFSWVPILGFLASLAAIIIGAMARKREPAAPHWMWIVGIIAGAVALVIGIIVVVIFIIGIAFQAAAVNSLTNY